MKKLSYKTISQVLCIAVSMLFTVYAKAQLVPFTSNYVAYYKGKDVGKASLELNAQSTHRYELKYHSSVSRFFLSDRRYETSIFDINEETIVPVSYHYRREGTGSNKNLELNFDQTTKTIIVDKTTSLEWNDELDNQLFRIDLPKRLANGEREFNYDFINYRGEKRSYVFEVLDAENLSLPYGQINALKVKIDRDSSRRLTYAWFSPELDYSLVRLQQFKDGKEQGDIKLADYSRHTKEFITP
jgi:hypothetical protein